MFENHFYILLNIYSNDNIYIISYTGSPNITTSVDTNIKNRSVKLIGSLYFFDDSPGILDTFWTKYDEKINTQESGEKLSEISNDYPSLTITNVGPDDAGEYHLTAINAVGSSTSEAIVLGILISYLKKKYFSAFSRYLSAKKQTCTCIIEF